MAMTTFGSIFKIIQRFVPAQMGCLGSTLRGLGFGLFSVRLRGFEARRQEFWSGFRKFGLGFKDLDLGFEVSGLGFDV